MSESKLRRQSMEFSVSILNLVKNLKAQRETIVANQIGRSDTGYWLELLHRTGYLSDANYKSLNDVCTSLRVMLIASLRTATVK